MTKDNSSKKWKLTIARQNEEDYVQGNYKEDTQTRLEQKTEHKPIKSKGTLGKNVD